MGQFPAFVLVSCLRMMDKSDEDQARATRLFDLSLNARILQVLSLEIDTNKSGIECGASVVVENLYHSCVCCHSICYGRQSTPFEDSICRNVGNGR